ncbi:MAG: hypothetical protein KAX20_04030 [Candidatus Omnitrophica bacterium]|nr:hypothetical protein [Candidatus Omnitrophota bacterium]
MARFERISRDKIGQILIAKGIITKEQLKEVLYLQRRDGGLTGEILCRLGYTTEEEIIEAILTQYNIPYLSPDNYNIDKKVIKLIPMELVLDNCFIPVDISDNSLLVIMADPFDEETTKKIEEISKHKVKIFIATSSQIKKAIEKYYKNIDGHRKGD